MLTVMSTDGTTIAFDRTGEGPALILVDGALCDRSSGPNGPLAGLLAERFTVFTYDRRGRGDSGDTAPYAVEREIEDLDALIVEAGGSASVYGISSGGALALEAANRLRGITRLALYEVPFVVDDTRRPLPAEYQEHLGELIASDRRAQAVRYFMRKGVGLPAFVVGMMRLMPAWSRLKAVAHTLPYDAAVLAEETGAGRPLPTDRWASVTVPTLVARGGKSPDWMRNAAAALAALLGAELRTLEGQTHIVKPKALAPVLAEFFAAESGSRRVENDLRAASVVSV